MQSIVIADHHNLCRTALCDYIRHADGQYAVEGVANYQGLIEYLKTGTPDLILIASDLAGLEDGEPFAPEGVKIGMIVPLAYQEDSGTSRLHGVFPKSLSCKAFLKGIGEIFEGRDFFPEMPRPDSFEDGKSLRRNSQDFSLTTREKEVLGHLVKGESNKDIARALDLQVVTIKLHVRGICRKMRASNRTQAALIAKENGWA